jgi:hypothetical protein
LIHACQPPCVTIPGRSCRMTRWMT